MKRRRGRWVEPKRISLLVDEEEEEDGGGVNEARFIDIYDVNRSVLPFLIGRRIITRAPCSA